MIKNLEQTLIKKVEDARTEVESRLFKEWKKADRDEREDIHSEARVLEKLTFRLIKSIRGNK